MQGNREIIDIFKLYIEMREKVGKEKADKWLSERIWQPDLSTVVKIVVDKVEVEGIAEISARVLYVKIKEPYQNLAQEWQMSYRQASKKAFHGSLLRDGYGIEMAESFLKELYELGKYIEENRCRLFECFNVFWRDTFPMSTYHKGRDKILAMCQDFGIRLYGENKQKEVDAINFMIHTGNDKMMVGYKEDNE
jgi:hypothetical protein